MINPMPPAKRKTQKKELSFEHYARAIQTDIARLGKSMEAGFKSIHEEMATKDDVRKVRQDMATHKNLLEVQDDVRRLNDIMVSKADLSETIRRELDASPFAKESEVKDLSGRLLRVEEKLGMKPGHRPA
jgi:hypothetical protein